MGTRILSCEDVARLLPMDECIGAIREALIAASRGDVVNPLRQMMWLPDHRGLLGMMPAQMQTTGHFGIKVVSFMPGNHGSPFDSHQGVVLLFEPEHGRLIGVMDATSITSIRTAAASAVATDALANPDASRLALIGSGVQAQMHLEAMISVRPVERVSVVSASQQHAADFATRHSRRFGLKIEVADHVQQAVRQADLICTVTSSREPVLRGQWIQPGAHINAVGACLKDARELDSDAVARSRLFVDRLESTISEAGDFLIPLAEGRIDRSHIAGEIGQVLLRTVMGRRDRNEVTLFKSLGLAVEDVAAASHLYQRAHDSGIGQEIELGGQRATGFSSR